jgi:hypothetical protein
MSCKFIIFGVLDSSFSSYKDEDGSACDVIDVIVLAGVEIIIDVIFFFLMRHLLHGTPIPRDFFIDLHIITHIYLFRKRIIKIICLGLLIVADKNQLFALDLECEHNPYFQTLSKELPMT